MNKNEIVTILKEEMKIVCKDCKSDIDKCFKGCPVHRLVNRIVEALNGN